MKLDPGFAAAACCCFGDREHSGTMSGETLLSGTFPCQELRVQLRAEVSGERVQGERARLCAETVRSCFLDRSIHETNVIPSV